MHCSAVSIPCQITRWLVMTKSFSPYSFKYIELIAILYCAVAIPALSIVYLMNYGKYNQTILLLCILGLNIFLISQIIFLFFRKRYNKYMPANAAITIQPRPTSDTTHTSEPWCNEAQLAAHSKAIPKNELYSAIENAFTQKSIYSMGMQVI